MTIEQAEERKIANPSCTVCPQKWASRLRAVTQLLREAIRNGQFVSEQDAGTMPGKVWIRDPDDRRLVYEAKIKEPPDGYKAYPLTRHQAQALPIQLQ